MANTMTPDAAVAQAIEATSLDDFGPAGWREGLERTLDGFARAPLSEAAWQDVQGKIVLDLSTRLRIEQWYKDHPEVEDETMAGPVLVCGLPRTGTTATLGMMATDPRYRFLRSWEGMSPVPPPIAGEEEDDPRAVAARKMAVQMDQSRHIFDPDGPQEDLSLLAPFNMHAYNGAYPMPSDYLDWWMNSEMASTYSYSHRVYKLLQSRRGPNLWLLKAPVHLFQLDAFVAEWPDTKFIWTHRAPDKVIPSVSSLQYGMNSERSVAGALEKSSYGPAFLAFWREAMGRALAARERIGEERFIDVWNDDVVAKPIETFESIYDKLGFNFTPEMLAGLEDYNRRNARGAHGEHRYTAEEYGTSRGEIRAALSDYIERFGL
ncbi:MAG: sulfotransferase [Novosphingobium sp.]|nr:sulfotransferase [Novosphingobium sp.]